MQKNIFRKEGASMRSDGGRTAGVKMLAMTALFMALSYVATSLLVIPVPGGGYLNLGDTIVLLGAYLLGPAYGAVAGGVGSALADLLAGYGIYVPATLVIKMLMSVMAAGLYKMLRKKNWVPVACGAAAEAFMAAGYSLYEAFLGGSLAAGLPGLPANLLQGAFGLAVSTLLVLALKKSRAVREFFPYF